MRRLILTALRQRKWHLSWILLARRSQIVSAHVQQAATNDGEDEQATIGKVS